MVSATNFISHHFKLFRGTRQGSPISPILFIMAMEHLAIAIRSHPSILGIKTGDVVHNTAMCADDTIVFLSNLAKSLPSLSELFHQFRASSGFKVNKEKSSIMFLNAEKRKNPSVYHPFVNTSEGFKYFGIKITQKISNFSSPSTNPW